MPHPKLTDDAVSRLPLHAGRAELLEEIMSTPVGTDTRTAPTTTPGPGRGPRRSARWLAPVAAAAAVGVLATAPVWWPESDEERIVGPAAQPPEVATGHRAVLDLPGWDVSNTSERPRTGGEISYTNGAQRLAVRWSPKESYADYVEDREHISDPPAPGEPVEVLGADGQLWHYSATDHTVIREVQDGYWMEIRGSGMDDTAYRELLDRLRLVDREGFEESLPPAYVVTGERAEAIAAILDEIDAHADPLAPPQTGLQVDSEESDPYHLGVDVTGVLGCVWIAEFADAKAEGDQARMRTAQDVLATSHRWPVLLEMQEDGDWPQVFWEIADTVVERGRVPVEYAQGLGCD